jgi:AraC family transcriptional regulator
VFSHVVSDLPMPEKTLADQAEPAFAIHVEHRPLVAAETWVGGRHANLPPIAEGGVWIFDLEAAPLAIIRQPFDFSRFYMARATLDDLTYAHGLPRVTDLQAPKSGDPDPVLQHLALALIGKMKMLGEEVDSLFADWIALAFHAHVVRVYGKISEREAWRGGLTPQRLRFVVDLMTERLADPLSIKGIADQVGMAPGHFARAFRQATGEPPHQWLMRRRIERAKDLLRSPGAPLAEIALACGFVDQSHMTRVFSRSEKLTPGAWRRLYHS